MTELQSAIWNFLRERYAGPKNSAPRAAILARYNLLHRSQICDRDFREVVSQLVTIFKKPICTSPGGGYFIARTSREMEEAINYLKSAGASFFKRARALEETIPLERQERLF